MHDRSSVSYYRHRIHRVPRPERRDEQAQVARASDGDRDAIETLISSNLPYVIHLAKEFRGRGLPFEDLIAEGCVGVLKAIRRYRPANGTRFMTYASFWVRKEILAAVADQPHAIHVTRYARRHGHDAVRVLRLDGPSAPDGNQRLVDTLRHPDPLPTETILEGEQSGQLKREMLRLGTREQVVIAWRYGLGGEDPKTLNEIACRLGLSKERVRQIEVSALAHLRAAIVRCSLGKARARAAAEVRSVPDARSAI